MRKNNMRKIQHFLLVLCVVVLGSGWGFTVFAQTAIDLHTGRVTKARPNENPMSKQRIMARDRALVTQDSLDYNEAVAKAFLLLRAKTHCRKRSTNLNVHCACVRKRKQTQCCG